MLNGVQNEVGEHPDMSWLQPASMMLPRLVSDGNLFFPRWLHIADDLLICYRDYILGI